MCYGCWEDYGMPKTLNDKIIQAAKLIDAVYDNDSVGGNLHMQLDDWNIEDEHWEEYSIFRDDTTPEMEAAERACFDYMKNLTLQERATALAVIEHFIPYQLKEPPKGLIL